MNREQLEAYRSAGSKGLPAAPEELYDICDAALREVGKLSAIRMAVRSTCETVDPECWCPVEHDERKLGHTSRCVTLRTVLAVTEPDAREPELLAALRPQLEELAAWRAVVDSIYRASDAGGAAWDDERMALARRLREQNEGRRS